jgi:O-antigen/teichoic acid export membrane protein
MTSQLKTKAINAGFWSFLDSAGNQIVFFVSNIIIARILIPSDFGLIGMIAIFMEFSRAFIDSGFTTALVQKKDATNEDYSTVFYFNLLMACFFYIILFSSAQSIADFYNEPRLINITKIIGLNLIINAFGSVQLIILIKNLNFKRKTLITIISITIAGITGIIMALSGYGYWSLVYKSLLSAFMLNIGLWIISNWKPSYVFSKSSFKSLFSFGSKLLLAGLLYRLYKYIYNVIIGKYYTASDLGYFTQANQFQSLPVMNLNTIIGNVTFPTMSKVQDDSKKVKEIYRRIFRVVSYLNFPIMLGLLLVSKEFIVVFLTEKWIETSVYLKILCIGGLVFPFGIISNQIFYLRKRSDIFLTLEIVKKAFSVLIIIITIQISLIALVIGLAITMYFDTITNVIISNRMINYSFKETIRDIYPSFIITIIMCLQIIIIKEFVELDIFLKLCLEIFSGIIIYLFFSFLFKIKANNEFFEMVNIILKKKK